MSKVSDRPAHFFLPCHSGKAVILFPDSSGDMPAGKAICLTVLIILPEFPQKINMFLSGIPFAAFLIIGVTSS